MARPLVRPLTESGARLVAVLLAFVLLLAFWFFAGAASAAAPAAAPATAPDGSFTNAFREGVEGLFEATQAAKSDGRPIFVYFYTDWCGYCRQFERELLTQGEVQDYLRSIYAVRINAEGGPAEAQIARRYRVNSFPTLFVHSSESERVSRVDRVEIVDGKPRMLSAGGFIDVVKRAGAR